MNERLSREAMFSGSPQRQAHSPSYGERLLLGLSWGSPLAKILVLFPDPPVLLWTAIFPNVERPVSKESVFLIAVHSPLEDHYTGGGPGILNTWSCFGCTKTTSPCRIFNSR